MKKVYFWIALLAIYGDLLKRVLPAQLAIAALYFLALAILAVIVLKKRKGLVSYKISKEGAIVRFMSIVLVLLYIFQALTSFSVKFIDSAMLALYVSTPLLYIIVFSKRYPDFDLEKLAILFLWMMIPINIVGIIQYFVVPGFLISTSYSRVGGVIARNFLIDGSFTRYPSIFASADRYSAMALMQFYFTVVLINNASQQTRQRIQWLAFNLVSTMLALGISGARSRILIVIVVLSLVLFIYFMRIKYANHMQKVLKALVILSIIVVMTFFVLLLDLRIGDKFIETFSILSMLRETFETGDVAKRVGEGIAISMFPDDITIFGEGLAKESPMGRPGEFAIRVIWKESGIFFGMIMLAAFAGIIIVLGKLTFNAVIKLCAAQVIMYGIPLMLMIFALLAGLTSAFELSTGILMACSIVAITCKKVERRKRIYF